MLYDSLGREIPDEKLRSMAMDKFNDFLNKHKDKFQQWFSQRGAYVKPPIKFDLKRKEWVWLDD